MTTWTCTTPAKFSSASAPTPIRNATAFSPKARLKAVNAHNVGQRFRLHRLVKPLLVYRDGEKLRKLRDEGLVLIGACARPLRRKILRSSHPCWACNEQA